MDRLTGGAGLPDQLPVGRRVAYWRGLRRMSQQVFADRLGKSKSWVDKVERGVRRLDKVSVLREIADVLRVSVTQLTGAADTDRDGPGSAPGAGPGPAPEVEAVRAALTRYEVQLGRRPVTVPDVDELERAVAHAWLTLGRADYEPLLRGLPELIVGGQWCRADARDRQRAGAPAGSQASDRTDGRDWRPGVLLGQVYQIAADLLRRLGVPDLAWLAADRAMTTGADSGEPWWAARAAIPLATVVRDKGRPRHTFELCIVTAHRLAGPNPLDGAPEHLSVYGSLLLHAALGAAAFGDRASTVELLDQAEAVATIVGPGRDHYRTCFGPGLVGVGRVAVAVELGHGEQTLPGLAKLAADPDHQRLPVAVRAAYLLDVARAHLQAGDPVRAGRAVLAAERTAAAEVRLRPAAREVLSAVLRASARPEPSVTRLAEALGVTV